MQRKSVRSKSKSPNIVSQLGAAAAMRIYAPYKASSPAQIRLLVALSAVLFLLISARSVLAGQITAAHQPVLVRLVITDPVNQLDQDSPKNIALRRATIEQINTVHAANPNRMITIELRRVSLAFAHLDSTDQQQIQRAHDNESAQWYENAMDQFLLEIIRETGHTAQDNLRLSVHGLPIEGTSAAAVNAHYAGTIAELDAIVSAKNIIISRNGNEAATVENALPQAMRFANNRPIFYRANNQWRMLTPQSQQSTVTGHTAQDELKSQALAVANSNAQIQAILRQHNIDLDGNNTNRNMSDLHALLADWNSTDSPWDLNHDGIVNVADLMILLANWENDEPTTGIARFVNLESTHTIGSGDVIQIELLDDAPANANVVFQTWSDETHSIEAPYPDYNSPFIYPSAALDLVTPGSAEVQALIRDQTNHVVLRLTAHVEFLENPWSGDSDPDGDDPDLPDPDPNPHPNPDPNPDPNPNPIPDPNPNPNPHPNPDPEGNPTDPTPDTPYTPQDELWNALYSNLDLALIELLQDVALPAQPQLDNPQQVTVRSVNDIPNPIGNNKIITVEGVIDISDPNDGFNFNQDASDIILRFAPGARLNYLGGDSYSALIQFRTSCRRIRIENAVITGPVGTSNTCHGFATTFGNGNAQDITIVGGDVSGVRYTFQGEGGVERLLIMGVNAHDNWEYFVWGSNNFKDVTIYDNDVDGVVAQHGIRIAPGGPKRINIVNNSIRIGGPGLIKRSIWMVADNAAILNNHTRDGRITIGPDPTKNQPGPTNVILAGNRIDHERNNKAIEVFAGTSDVMISGNTITTPHADWMQVGHTDPYHRTLRNIHWTEDNTANGRQRHDFDGISVSPSFAGQADIGPVD